MTPVQSYNLGKYICDTRHICDSTVTSKENTFVTPGIWEKIPVWHSTHKLKSFKLGKYICENSVKKALCLSQNDVAENGMTNAFWEFTHRIDDLQMLQILFIYL